MKRPSTFSARIRVAIVWGSAGVIAAVLDGGSSGGREASQFAYSLLLMGFGGWGFWAHGRSQITAAGLSCLAVAIFGGYAAYYWQLQPGPVDSGTYIATVATYWSTLAMYVIWWSPPQAFEKLRVDSSNVTRWAMGAGLISTVVLAFANLYYPLIAAMAILMMAVLLHRRRAHPAILRLGFSAALVGLFFSVAFTGFGRLTLVSLALVPAIGTSAIFAGRFVKAALLCLIAPTLWALSVTREQFGRESVGSTLDGMGSVVDPLRDFGRIIEAHQGGAYALGHGDSFWAAAVFWVPRDWWPSKPIGFGAELTERFFPSLRSINFSMAAHSGGEWYHNFGWLGLALMVVILGWFIRSVDRTLSHSMSVPIVHRFQFLKLMAIILVVAEIPSLIWAGTFIFTERTVLKLVVIACLWLAFGWRRGTELHRWSTLSESGRASA